MFTVDRQMWVKSIRIRVVWIWVGEEEVTFGMGLLLLPGGIEYERI